MQRLLALGASLLLAGCGSDPAHDAGPTDPDAGVAVPDASAMDAGAPDAGATEAGATDAGATDAGATDAGATDAGAMDAGAMDAGPADAGVPASDAAEGAVCSFNRECAAAARCECDEVTGCMCVTGARGTGRNGVDPCTTGDDCASAVCVEGSDGTFYCSGECATEADCGAALPRCIDIAFVGRICARTPPG